MKKIKILKIIIPACFLVAAALFFGKPSASASDIQQSIADRIVRFHVISASDSEYEQGLKLLVKNAVLEMLSDELKDADSKEQTLERLTELTPDILKLVRGVLMQNGSSASVSASVTECYFPIKVYGDLTLPAGNYTAFRLVIGEGKGTNWWCVLYPRLCFVDATYGIVPDESKAEFKALLSEDEYNTVFGQKVVYRFKILKFLNKYMTAKN